MAVRSIELLVREYPNLTAKEILDLHERDKANDKKAEEKRNKKKLAFIKDINENGGYYRGRFGYDQHYYYNVTRMFMEGDEIYMDVEKIVMFCNPEGIKNIVTRPGDFHLERERKEYQKEDNYMLGETCERVTRKEWDAVNDYLDAMQKLFWKPLK